MFNELIALAREYCKEMEKFFRIYDDIDKRAARGSHLHTELLKRSGIERQGDKVSDIRALFINLCWDCKLNPDSVLTIAKWMHRNHIDKLSMTQWLPLVSRLA